MGRAFFGGGKVGMKGPSLLPPIGTALNDLTWEEIRAISDAGKAADYFSVGDSKAVVLNGTVGNLTLSNYTVYAYILGIDHNSELEGANRIHFVLGKNALSNGKDVALCDSKNGGSVSATNWFNMNQNNVNAGGWKDSQMRNNICGTSLTDYSGTIIAVIPDALRAVLKPVTKYTDNTGNSSTTASVVTATTDYFFLLSEFEVFGTISEGNTNEASKQKQYDYYKSGNSKVKYNHSSPTTAVRWWLRSPHKGSSSYFTYVYTSGAVSYSYPRNSFGFTPAFCV